MSYETIILEKADGIASITLNRPDKLNALNNTMQEDFMAVFEDVAEDDAVRIDEEHLFHS